VFDRMQFGHTITTYMHPYEVPSGEPFALKRSAVRSLIDMPYQRRGLVNP